MDMTRSGFERNRAAHPRATRILVLHQLPSRQIAGTPRNVLDMVRGFTERGLCCEALVPEEGRTADILRGEGLPCHVLPLPPGRLRSLIRLAKFLHRKRYDLVSVFGFGRVACVAARLSCRARTVHHVTGLRELMGTNWMNRSRFMAWAVDRWVDAYIAPSRAVIADSIAHGCSPGKIYHVPNGIDLSRILGLDKQKECAAIRAELGIPHDALVVGNVGRLSGEKGQGFLLTAFGSVRTAAPAYLLLVGDGDLREHLVAHARSMGILDRVILAGYREDIPRLLCAMDIFAFPSLSEGFGVALLEAMAAGLPIVGSSIPALAEAIGGDGCGVLVPPRDSVALAAALQGFVEDAPRRRRSGEAARERSKLFTVERMLDGMLGVYNRVLGRKLVNVPEVAPVGSVPASG
jgi:glycosyltransferase involved in cell wall biosynthesis